MTSTDRLLELAIKGLEAERHRIDQEIADIQNQLYGKKPLAVSDIPAHTDPIQRTGRMSEAGRRKISQAMKLRWNKRRMEKAAPIPSDQNNQGGITEAGRKKISDMMKKRWAEKKKAAKSRW